MQKTIKSGKSQLTIDTQGGKIVELVLDDKKILGTFSRIDGKTGATHICTPNFAGEGMEIYGLPFHGPSRNMEWQVARESENMIEINVRLEALEKYKSALEVKQIFVISEKEFSQEVHVKNVGKFAAPVNIGIHNYFHTPNGWKEAKINNKSIKKEIEKNLSVPVGRHPGFVQDQTTDLSDSGVARVYGELAEPLPRMTSKLVFSPPKPYPLNATPSLTIETQGAADFVTWTGVKDGNYDDKYACVEPVCWFDTKFYGTPPSLLLPEETRILKQSFSLQ